MHKQKLDSSKIKILICCHKPCQVPSTHDEIFLPIQVGSALSDLNLGIQRDDQVFGRECDNISKKNISYCELTAIYWAWKNIKLLYPNIEYIGINHYRRYFSWHRHTIRNVIYLPENSIKTYKLNRKTIDKYLQAKYAIIAKKKNYPYPLSIDYSVCHISDDIRTLQEIIKKCTPEYANSADIILNHENKLSPYNMFILPIKVFDQYCNWLFKILTEVEKEININCYNSTQKRIYGYMAERLFNVWLAYTQIRTKEFPIVMLTETPPQQLGILRTLLDNFRTSFCFYIRWGYVNTPIRKFLNTIKYKK